MNERTLVKLREIIDSERKSGLRDGLSAGIIVAERIFIWYAVNLQLKEPYSPEKLEKWARDCGRR